MNNESTYSFSAKKKSLNFIVSTPIFLIILAFVAYSLVNMNEIINTAQSPLILVKRIYWHINRNMIEQPLYYVGMPVVFLLQWIWPVDPKQKQLSAATRVDILFTLSMIGFYVLITPAYVQFLKGFSFNYIPVLEISFFRELPTVMQLLIGYLAVDFLGWFHHLVRHKIPFFWTFHAVHHSQRELNPFSNERLHIFDWLVANTIKFIPAFFFTESLGIILHYIVIHKFLDHLNHANVKTNLGPLKYILVTPQSHRVHHSGEKAYFEKNFGVSLSIWDHIFGTQCREYDVYPTTGIPDLNYPYEKKIGFFNELKSFFYQQVYPFKKIWQDLTH